MILKMIQIVKTDLKIAITLRDSISCYMKYYQKINIKFNCHIIY